MLVLAIDSTMNGCSAGVYCSDQGLLSSESHEMNRGQAERLMPMIGCALEKAAKVYADIDLIAVTKGPGAFTGMRIGLATAKALSLAMNVPVIGVCTFQAVLHTGLAEVDDVDGRYAVLIETKRQDFYVQLFKAYSKEQVIPLSEAQSMPLSEISVMFDGNICVLIGDALDRFRAQAQGDLEYLSFVDVSLPSLKSIAYLALCDEHGNKEGGVVKPAYIRAPDVSLPKNPPRILDLDVFSG